MNERIARIFIAAVLVGTSLASTEALAQGRPLPQHVLSRGAADDAVRARSQRQPAASTRRNDRVLYGRIDAIGANVLLVRARNGRELHVDDAQAIAAGTYSAPLFIGKLVLITGYYDANRTMHALSITRESRIDAKTASDR